jgi:hypothetical protein
MLKEWTCVQVGHHKRIGEVIARHQNEGWSLHTYQTQGTTTTVIHYLLFERDEDDSIDNLIIT